MTYYLDLLFFHIEKLRYVVIELKTGKFQPEYAGKLNFYVALVDDCSAALDVPKK
ncbi:PDDEXK nuclease domain-containing protein [Arthrobacter sp. NPDC057009]|uniref:PDDEXK nuclease domain-containing protein n=1 Tax=Arthrobacter sp. NPDC057009 TaxID=3345996 RepID=UPI003645EC86